MTEYERLLVIEKINKKIELSKIREDKRLRKDELKEMIELEFSWALNDINKEFSQCSHRIWFYWGSFTSCNNKDFYVYDEENKKFSYNRYICLECNGVICTKDWKWFEKENIVLKTRKNINIAMYQKQYYQLLYSHTVEESQSLIIEEFNKNIVKPKKKIKQK